MAMSGIRIQEEIAKEVDNSCLENVHVFKFMKKLRADWIQGTLAKFQHRIVWLAAFLCKTIKMNIYNKYNVECCFVWVLKLFFHFVGGV
jgi:hypothetical protein